MVNVSMGHVIDESIPSITFLQFPMPKFLVTFLYVVDNLNKSL